MHSTADLVFQTNEAFLREDGRVGAPGGDMSPTGSGPSILEPIDRVDKQH